MSDVEQHAVTWSPPYIAWRNLLNLLERLETNMPPQIDRTFLTGSGQSNTQTMNALKSLELIGTDGSILPRLIALVEAGADRPAEIRKMLERFYPEPVRLGTVNGTQKQLEEAFDAYGVSGDTRRKAIAFFLKAAAYAKLPISPNCKTPSNRTQGARRRRPKAKATTTTRSETPSERTTTTDLQARYIEMLMKKVESQDDMDTELLDRIESLLELQTEEA